MLAGEGAGGAGGVSAGAGPCLKQAPQVGACPWWRWLWAGLRPGLGLCAPRKSHFTGSRSANPLSAVPPGALVLN